MRIQKLKNEFDICINCKLDPIKEPEFEYFYLLEFGPENNVTVIRLCEYCKDQLVIDIENIEHEKVKFKTHQGEKP